MLSAYNAQLLEQQAKLQESEPIEKTIQKQYEQVVKQYALYDGFSISILQVDDDTWQPKTFRYHKITIVDYEKSKEIMKIVDVHTEPDTTQLEYERQQQQRRGQQQQHYDPVQTTLDYYKFLASCFLKMSDEDFDRCDWGKTRLVIDACIYRTEHTLVDQSIGLEEFFHIDIISHLTSRDLDMLRMYRLWIGKADIKPWDINGGFIYEEDINTFLKLEELHMEGEKRKAKKEEAYEKHLQNGSRTVVGSSNNKHVTRTTRHR